MKSLDKILKGLMKSKSLALADELLKNYNLQINSLNTTKEQLVMNNFLNNTLPAESLPTIAEQLRQFGKTITGTPAPKDESGQIEMQAHYTIKPQNVSGNN